MTVRIFTPASREEWLALRAPTCGASEAPALLGLDPRTTAFEVFASKTGRYKRAFAKTEIREKSIHLPPHEKGNFLEEKGFELTRMLRPEWTVTSNAIPGGHFYQDLALGISATPDDFLTAPDRPGSGAIQIKNLAQRVLNKDDWTRGEGDFELPGHVAVQTIIDAFLSGCQWACAGIMVTNFGVDFYLEEVPLHSGILSRVLAEAAEFQRRLREDDPYPPDYARDGDVIKQFYADDNGGTTDLDCTLDIEQQNRVAKMAARHLALKKIESAAHVA
jgi:hypothetical protein